MTMIDTVKKQIVLKRVCAVVAALGWWLCASGQANNPPYKLVDLGVVGPAGQPFQITNNGIIAGAVETPDGTADHAVIYFRQQMFDISKPGLGGANSEAIGVNGWGEVVGGANTPNVDPHGEDFCGFQTSGIPSATESCLPFLWQQGRMIALPTLDDNQGNNGLATSINAFGAVAGTAENTIREPSCPTYDPAAFQFQQYQFKPVLWQDRRIKELATLGGDPVGAAKVVNYKGQAVGATGTCAVSGFPLGYPMHALHAVLWEKDGTPIDLGSLGGNEQSFWGNVAEGLNDHGHVVGSSSLSDNVTFHAFLWTGERGMRDLMTAAGLPDSWAIAINDRDEVVGVSTDLATQFIATLWKDGVAWDLNTLIPKSPLQLLAGCSIDSRGQIIGLALDASGNYHGYELIPTDK